MENKELLTFRLLLERAGFDRDSHNRIKLLRHPLDQDKIKNIYEMGYIDMNFAAIYTRNFGLHLAFG